MHVDHAVSEIPMLIPNGWSGHGNENKSPEVADVVEPRALTGGQKEVISLGAWQSRVEGQVATVK